MGQSSNPSKSRHSRGSLWPWCEADWLWQPSPRRWAVWIFWNVLAGVRTEVVFSVSSLPAGMVIRMKSQLIRTKPWLETKNCQACVTKLRPIMVDDERMWSPATSLNLVKLFVANELFPDVTLYSSLTSIPCSRKCSTGATTVTGSWQVRKQMVGTRLPAASSSRIYPHKQSPRRQQPPRTSCGPLTVITGWSCGPVDLCLEGHSTNTATWQYLWLWRAGSPSRWKHVLLG